MFVLFFLLPHEGPSGLEITRFVQCPAAGDVARFGTPPYQKLGLLVTNGQQVPDTSNDVVDGQKQQDLKVLLKSF